MTIDELYTSTKLCPQPWNSLFMQPSGIIKMCCRTTGDVFAKSYQVAKYEDVINSDRQKETRLSMLSGKLPACCHKCESVEQDGGKSFRYNMLKRYENDGDLFAAIENTQLDGSIDSALFKIKYLELHPQNTCNLKCQMCIPEYSSAIAAEYKKYRIPFTDVSDITEHNENFVKMVVDKNKDNIKGVNFAGGEPLLNPMLWNITDLVSNDIDIYIDTNCTVMSYRNKHIFDLLNSINGQKLVTISIDDIGDRYEYLRNGGHWETVKNNLQTYIDYAKSKKKVIIVVSIAVSTLNVMYLDNIYDAITDMGFDGKIKLAPVYTPEYLHCGAVLPDEIKVRLSKSKILNADRVMHASSIKHVLTYHQHGGIVSDFKKHIAVFDERNNKNFKDIYPELYEQLF